MCFYLNTYFNILDVNMYFEVLIPTFINCHLFWVIKKESILIRKAIECNIKCKRKDVLDNANIKTTKEQITVACIDNVWVRIEIEYDLTEKWTSMNNTGFICWLIDYGIMRIVESIFTIDSPAMKCPPLAQKASLYNVVNLNASFSSYNDEGELTKAYKKTFDEIPGITKTALDIIEASPCLHFFVVGNDKDIIYGDITYFEQSGQQRSLRQFLMDKKLLQYDPTMFNQIKSRDITKQNYFKLSRSWHSSLNESIASKKTIFNSEMNVIENEYFKHVNERCSQPELFHSISYVTKTRP